MKLLFMSVIFRMTHLHPR